MTEASLRQWVDVNPGRVNDRDEEGYMPLYVAAHLSLVLWLLDEKGADVNVTTSVGWTALHRARSLDILNALLDRGADPTMLNEDEYSPLMWQAFTKKVNSVARLLQDARVKATVDVRNMWGGIALYESCRSETPDVDESQIISVVHLLLQAGADPTITDDEGRTVLVYLQRYHPTCNAAIALLEQALADVDKTWLIVKARRLVMAPISSVAPPYLQSRMADSQPLPRVAQASVTAFHSKTRKRHRKFRTLMVFLLGLGGGPKGEGMPRDVFRVVMDLLMPSWDPLRCGDAGIGPAVQD